MLNPKICSLFGEKFKNDKKNDKKFGLGKKMQNVSQQNQFLAGTPQKTLDKKNKQKKQFCPKKIEKMNEISFPFPLSKSCPPSPTHIGPWPTIQCPWVPRTAALLNSGTDWGGRRMPVGIQGPLPSPPEPSAPGEVRRGPRRLERSVALGVAVGAAATLLALLAAGDKCPASGWGRVTTQCRGCPHV